MTEQEQIDQLYSLVCVHPYKDELLDIMYQQQLDDADMCSNRYDERLECL